MDAASTVAELCNCAAIFDRVAGGLMVEVRKAMNVPEQADADVEEEFSSLRAEFDAFLPEFQTLFTGLLIQHIGQAQLPEVLATLGTEGGQRYLQAAHRIEAELEQFLAPLSQKMCIVARRALAAQQLQTRQS